jgi:hypothetical protein
MIFLAMDRAASARYYDVDGRLHVTVSNISKANVCGYYGREIPNGAALGLDPDHSYDLLRDPAELAKAAATFNNLPILNRHIPVNSERPMKEFVVGSTGTDADFSDPYLRNSSVIWVQDSIDLIESDDQKEWSCGYRYVADMTPGIYKGLRYDGAMRNIVGNHVALVAEGRAGSDCVVGDSQIMLKSRKALMLTGALAAYVRPKLATNAKLDIALALDGVTAANLASRAPKLAARLSALIIPQLAQDEAGCDVDDIVKVIAAVQGVEMPDADDVIDLPAAPDAVDADDGMAAVMEFLKGKLSDADLAECAKMMDPAMKPGDKDTDKDKPAMDAKAIRLATIADMNAIRDAERVVFPFVGALDQAPTTPEAVYKLALDAAGVDLTGLEPSAYAGMVRMLKKSGEAPPRIALDGATGARADFAKRFPNAKTPARS